MGEILSMNKIDAKILDIDKVICKNIDVFKCTERGLLSQNILSQLRNFVEHISLKYMRMDETLITLIKI